MTAASSTRFRMHAFSKGKGSIKTKISPTSSVVSSPRSWAAQESAVGLSTHFFCLGSTLTLGQGIDIGLSLARRGHQVDPNEDRGPRTLGPRKSCGCRDFDRCPRASCFPRSSMRLAPIVATNVVLHGLNLVVHQQDERRAWCVVVVWLCRCGGGSRGGGSSCAGGGGGGDGGLRLNIGTNRNHKHGLDFFCRAFLHLPDAKFWFQSAYGRSTSSSPKGMCAPSLASTGWAGNSRSDCACARMAASAARAVHLRASARLAAARAHVTRSRARALASRRSSANASPLNRPPTSAASVHGRLAAVRGKCGACARLPVPAPARASRRHLAGAARRGAGLTSVVSTAICAPCHRGQPLATTSILRPFVGGTSRFRSWRATLVATRAPASGKMRADARCKGKARCARTPHWAQAERWWPSASKAPPHRQRRGVSGGASRSLRSRRTRNSSFGIARSGPDG